MNNIIATHYDFGVNPCVNQICNKVLSCVRQSGEVEILIANHMIVLLFILPENLVSVWIQFDGEVASALSLLRWDHPFPF